MNPPKANPFLKLTAASTALLLLLGGNTPLTLAVTEVAAVRATAAPEETEFLTRESLEKLEIPETLGYVQRLAPGKTEQVVLLLQDAHANVGAQNAIWGLIDYFSKKHGLSSVVLEGGQGALDPTLFSNFPEPEILRSVFQSYVDRGELSGAIPAAVLAARGVSFEGAEEATLYEEQLDFYYRARSAEGLALAWVETELEKTAGLKKSLFSSRMQSMDTELQALEKDPSRLLDTLQTFSLWKEPAEYPHLKLVTASIADMKKSDAQANAGLLGAMASEAVVQLRDAGARARLQRARQAYHTGEMSALRFAGILEEEKRGEDPGFRLPEELEAMIRRERTLDRMKGAVFFEEFERYVRAAAESLLETPEARRLYEHEHRLRLYRKLARLELTRREWDEVKLPAAGQEPPAELFRDSRLFYDCAGRRDRNFYQVLKTAAQKKKDVAPVLMIAGGFHTEGVTALLEKEGISFAVLAPAAGAEEAPERYAAVMRGEVSWKKHLRFEGGRASLYRSFTEAAAPALLHEYGKKTGNFEGILLKRWRDELLRKLADERRLDQASRYTSFLDETARQFQDPASEHQRQEWKARIERFRLGLRELLDKQQLTDGRLARLFAHPAAAPITDKPLFPELYLPQRLAVQMTGLEPRAELRAAESRPAPAPEPKKIEAGASPPPPRGELRDLGEDNEAMRWLKEQFELARVTALRPDLPEVIRDLEGRVQALEKETDAEKYLEYQNLRFQLESFYRPLLAETVSLESFTGGLFKALRRNAQTRLSLDLTPFAHLETPSYEGLEVPAGSADWQHFSFRKTSPEDISRLAPRLLGAYAAVPFSDGFVRLQPASGEISEPETAVFEIEQGTKSWSLKSGDVKLAEASMQETLQAILQKDLMMEGLVTPQEFSWIRNVEVRSNAQTAVAYNADGLFEKSVPSSGAPQESESPRLVLDRDFLKEASRDETARRILAQEIQAVLAQVRTRALLAHSDIGFPVLLRDGSHPLQVQSMALLKLYSLRFRLRQFLGSENAAAEIEFLKQSRYGESSLAPLLEKALARKNAGESTESVLDALLSQYEAEEGSLTAFLMTGSGRDSLVSGFSAFGDSSQLLSRVGVLETLAGKFLLGLQTDTFRRFGANGFPNGLYWKRAPQNLKRRLVEDLAARVTLQRREKVRNDRYEARKLVVSEPEAETEKRRQLDFRLEPHQLLYKDFDETPVYEGSPHRLNGLMAVYKQQLESTATISGTALPAAPADDENQDESRLLVSMLADLGFAQKERIRVWTEAHPEAKKIEKLTNLLDYLTRHEWQESNMVFLPRESPRTVAELLGDEAGYFRSRWIDAHLNNAYYSRFGVFKELGFSTGNFAGKRDVFYSQLEAASVILALQRYPEFRALMGADDFDPAGWQAPDRLTQTVELARRILKDPRVQAQPVPAVDGGEAEEPVDTEDHFTFRDRYGLIIGRDLTRRVYSNLFLKQIRQAAYWEALLRKGVHRAEELSLTQALRDDIQKIAEGQKHFEDISGRRVLTLRVNRKNRITGVLTYHYDDSGHLLYRDQRELLKPQTVFDHARTVSGWQALEGDLFSKESAQRTFYADGIPVFRVEIGSKSSRDSHRVVKSVQVIEVEDGKIRTVQKNPLLQEKRAFEDSWTLQDWSRHAVVSMQAGEPLPETHAGLEADSFGFDRATRSSWEIYFKEASTEKVTRGRKTEEFVTSGVVAEVVKNTFSADFTESVEDSFQLLQSDTVYFREEHHDTSASAMRAFWDAQAGTLYGGLQTRTYVEFPDEKSEGLEKLKIHADPASGLVVSIETFVYENKKLISRDLWKPLSPFDLPSGFSLADWTERLPNLARRTERSFYDAKRRLRMEIEMDSSGALRMITRVMKAGREEKAFVYEGPVPEVLGNFDAAASLADWEVRLQPFDPLYETQGDDRELQLQLTALRSTVEEYPSVVALLRENEALYFDFMDFRRILDEFKPVRDRFRHWLETLEKARAYYGKYLEERRIRGSEDAAAIKDFTEKVTEPVLEAMAGGELPDLDLDLLLARTVSFGVQKEPRSVTGLDAGELAFVNAGVGTLTGGIPASEVTEVDVQTAADAILQAGKGELRTREPAGVRPELRSLQDKIREGMALHAKMEPVRAAMTRTLALMEASVRKYQSVDPRETRQDLELKFLNAAHGNTNTAWQSALWVTEYLHDTNGTFHNALDDSPLSLLYAAYRSKGRLRAPERIMDLESDPLLARLVRQGAPEHWNPQVAEDSLEALASQAEHRRQYDLITSFFSMNDREGTAGREEVVRKLRASARLLEKGGTLAITLSARRGFDEEALEQIRGMGFDVEDGIGFNRLTDEQRNELFRAGEDAQDEDAVFVENEIRKRRFYVVVLKKNRELSDEALQAAPASRIQITRFLEETGESEELHGPDDITLQSSSEREKKLKQVRAPHLEPSELEEKGTSVRQTPYSRRMADHDRFTHHRRQLELIHKYRHLLLGPASSITEQGRLQRIRNLLNSTYGENPDARVKFKGGKGVPGDFWKTPREVWLSDHTVQSFTFRDDQDRPVLTVLYTPRPGGKGLVTGISVHETSPAGEIIYTENRRLLRPDFEFDLTMLQGREKDAAVLRQWQILEDRAFEAAPVAGLKPLYSDQLDYAPRRRIYDQIEQVFDDLLMQYDLLGLFPEDARHPGLDFENLFKDGKALSILEFSDKQFPSGDYIFPFAEQREFIPQVFEKWRQGTEKLTLEDMEKYLALRRWIGDLRAIFQLLGPTFYRQKQKRSPTVGGGADDQEQARRHRRTLGGNTSYLSAHAVAPIVKGILQARGGKAKLLDQASGTGAMAEALSQQDVPRPDGRDFLYVEMDTDPNMLAEPRPEGFRTSEGVIQLRGDVTRLTDEFARLDFSKAPFDILTALFILDMLRPEDRKRMFIEANRNMTEGGEYILTVPQSWEMDNPEAFRDALYKLGFDVDTPVRGQHRARQEFLDRIVRQVTSDTGDESYAKEIAREVAGRIAKQFTILRLRKRAAVDTNTAQMVPASAFELKKTETGVRGAPTGARPFEHDPEAMRRWLEILRWLLYEWKARDIEVFNADDGNLVTREQITGPGGIFPEIATENALEHLYKYRFLFSSSAEAGNQHELITVNHQFWRLGSRYFHRNQILELRELYLRGPPKAGSAQYFSQQKAVQHLESRARALEHMANSKPVAGHHLRAAAAQARQIMADTRTHLEQAKTVHPLSYLAVPENDYAGRAMPFDSAAMAIFKSLTAQQEVLSVQLLVSLARFLERHKPGDDVAAGLLENPEQIELPKLPAVPKPAQAESTADAADKSADRSAAELPEFSGESLSLPGMQKDMFAIRTRSDYAVGKGERIMRDSENYEREKNEWLRSHPVTAGQDAETGILEKSLSLAHLQHGAIGNMKGVAANLMSLALELNHVDTDLHGRQLLRDLLVPVKDTDGIVRYQKWDFVLMNGKEIEGVYFSDGPLTEYAFQENPRLERVKRALGIEWSMKRIQSHPELLPAGIRLSPKFKFQILSVDAPFAEDLPLGEVEKRIESIPASAAPMQQIKEILQLAYRYLKIRASSPLSQDMEDIIVLMNNVSSLSAALHDMDRDLMLLIETGVLTAPDALQKPEVLELLGLLNDLYGTYVRDFVAQDQSQQVPGFSLRPPLRYAQLLQQLTGRDYGKHIGWEPYPGHAGGIRRIPEMIRILGMSQEQAERMDLNKVTFANPAKMLDLAIREVVRKRGASEPLSPEEEILASPEFQIRTTNLYRGIPMAHWDAPEAQVIEYWIRRMIRGAGLSLLGGQNGDVLFNEALNKLTYFVNYRNTVNRKMHLIPLLYKVSAGDDYDVEAIGRTKNSLVALRDAGTLPDAFRAEEVLARAEFVADEKTGFLAKSVHLHNIAELQAGTSPSKRKQPYLKILSPQDPALLDQIENPALDAMKKPAWEDRALDPDKQQEIQTLLDEELNKQELRTQESIEAMILRAEEAAADAAKGRLALLRELNRPGRVNRTPEIRGKALEIGRAVIRRITGISEILDFSLLVMQDLDVPVPVFENGGDVLRRMEELLQAPEGQQDFRRVLTASVQNADVLGYILGADLRLRIYDAAGENFRMFRETVRSMALSDNPLEIRAAFRLLSRIWGDNKRTLQVPGLEPSILAATRTFVGDLDAFFTELMTARFIEKGFDPAREYGAMFLIVPAIPAAGIPLVIEAFKEALRRRIRAGAFKAGDVELANRYLRLFFSNDPAVKSREDLLRAMTQGDARSRTLPEQIFEEEGKHSELRASDARAELRAKVSGMPDDQKLALFQSGWRTLLSRARGLEEIAPKIPQTARVYAAIFEHLRKASKISQPDFDKAISDLVSLSGLEKESLVPPLSKLAAPAAVKKRSLLELVREQQAGPVWNISEEESFWIGRKIDDFLKRKNKGQRNSVWNDIEKYVLASNEANRLYRLSGHLQQRLMMGAYAPEAFGDAIDKIEALRLAVGKAQLAAEEVKAREGRASLADLHVALKLRNMKAMTEAADDPAAGALERGHFTRYVDSIFYSHAEPPLDALSVGRRLTELLSKGLDPQSLAGRFAKYPVSSTQASSLIKTQVRPLVARALQQYRALSDVKQAQQLGLPRDLQNALSSDSEKRYAVLEQLSSAIWPRAGIDAGFSGARPQEVILFEEAVKRIQSVREIMRLARAQDFSNPDRLRFDPYPVFKRLDELLSTPLGKEEFAAYLQYNNWADSDLAGFFILGLYQPITQYPHYIETLRQYMGSQNPLLMIAAMNLLILYQRNLTEHELRKTGTPGARSPEFAATHEAAEIFAKELLSEFIRSYGFETEYYYPLFYDFYPQLLQLFPDFEDWLREAAAAVFREGLETSDFSKTNFIRFENAMAAAAGASRQRPDRVLGMDAAGTTNVFHSILTETIPGQTATWQKRYDEIQAAEKKRLEDPEIQKDLYAIVGRAIKTYETYQFQFPETFEDLLPVLNDPRIYAFHPDLKGHDLGDTGMLLQQFYLQYLRRQYYHALGESYRAMGQTAAELMDITSGKTDYRVRLKDPAGNSEKTYSLRADYVQGDGRKPSRLVFFPLGQLGSPSFLGDTRMEYEEELEAMMANAARLSRTPEISADGIDFKTTAFYVHPFSSDFSEIDDLESRPEALKAEIWFSDIPHFMDYFENQNKAIKERWPEYVGYLEALEEVYREPAESGDVGHFELAKKILGEGIPYLKSTVGLVEPGEDGKVDTQALTEVIERFRALTGALQIIRISRAYNKELEIGLLRAPKEQLKGAIAPNLRRINEIYRLAVLPIRDKQRDMARASPGASSSYPSSLKDYYDPASGNIQDHTQRDFKFTSQLDYHQAVMAQLAVSGAQGKGSELRASETDRALLDVPYGVLIANRNASRTLWDLSSRQRRHIDELVAGVYASKTPAERARKAKALEDYVYLGGQVENKRIWLDVSLRKTQLFGDYDEEQLLKGRNAVVSVLRPYQGERLGPANFPTTLQTGLANILTTFQSRREAMDQEADETTRKFLDHMQEMEFTSISQAVLESGDAFFLGLTNPKLKDFTGLARETVAILKRNPASKISEERSPERKAIFRLVAGILLEKNDQGKKLSDADTKENLAALRDFARQNEDYRVMILAAVKGFIEDPGVAFERRVRPILETLAETMDSPAEIFIYASHAAFIDRELLAYSEAMLRRMDQLLADPEQKAAFNKIILGSKWVRTLWIFLWDRREGSLADYDNIRELMLENMTSADSVLLDRTLGLVLILLAQKDLLDESRKQKAEAFAKRLFAKLIETHGTDIGKYGAVVEVNYKDAGVHWSWFRDSLVEQFKQSFARGERSDFAKAERWFRGMITARASSVEEAKQEMKKALHIDASGRSIFQRAAEGLPEEILEVFAPAIQQDFYRRVSAKTREMEKQTKRFPSYEEVSRAVAADRGVQAPEAGAGDENLIELSYLRYRWERGFLDMSRALAQSTIPLSVPQGASGLVYFYNYLVPGRNLVLPVIAFDSSGAVRQVIEFAPGYRQADYLQDPVLAHQREIDAFLHLNGRLVHEPDFAAPAVFNQADFTVTFLGPESRVEGNLEGLAENLKTSTSFKVMELNTARLQSLRDGMARAGRDDLKQQIEEFDKLIPALELMRVTADVDRLTAKAAQPGQTTPGQAIAAALWQGYINPILEGQPEKADGSIFSRTEEALRGILSLHQSRGQSAVADFYRDQYRDLVFDPGAGHYRTREELGIVPDTAEEIDEPAGRFKGADSVRSLASSVLNDHWRESLAVVSRAMRDLAAKTGKHSDFNGVLELLQREPERWALNPLFENESLQPGTPFNDSLEMAFESLERQRLAEQSFKSLGQIALLLSDPKSEWLFDVEFQDRDPIDETGRKRKFQMDAVKVAAPSAPGASREVLFSAMFMPGMRPEAGNPNQDYVDHAIGSMEAVGRIRTGALEAGALKGARNARGFVSLLNPAHELLNGTLTGDTLDQYADFSKVLDHELSALPGLIRESLKTVYRVLQQAGGSAGSLNRGQLEVLEDTLRMTRIALTNGFRSLYVEKIPGTKLDEVLRDFGNRMQGSVLPAATGELPELTPAAVGKFADGFELAWDVLENARPALAIYRPDYFGGVEALDTYFDADAGRYRPLSERQGRLTGLDKLELPTLEAYEARLKLYDKTHVHLWDLSEGEKETLRALVRQLLAASTAEAFSAADKRLAAYTGLHHSQVRGLAAYVLLRSEVHERDYSLENIQRALRAVEAQMPSADRVEDVSELIFMVYTLVEGFRDESLSDQERILLIIRTNAVFKVLNEVYQHMGQQAPFNAFLRRLPAGSPLAWFVAPVFDESRIPKDPTGLFSQLQRFAQNGDDKDLRRYAADSAVTRLRILQEAFRYSVSPAIAGPMPDPAQILNLVAPEIQSVEEMYDIFRLLGHLQARDMIARLSLFIPRLEALLAAPEQRELFNQTLTRWKSAHFPWTGLFAQALEYPVFDNLNPAYPNIRRAVKEASLSPDPVISAGATELVLATISQIENTARQAAASGAGSRGDIARAMGYGNDVKSYLLSLVNAVFSVRGFESREFFANLSSLSAVLPQGPQVIAQSAETAYRMHRQALKKDPQGPEAVRAPKFDVTKAVRFFNEMAAIGGAVPSQRDQLLGTQNGDLSNTRFHRVLRDELREAPASPLDLESTAEAVTAYLVHASVPPLLFRTKLLRLLQTAEAPGFEAALARVAVKVEMEAFAEALTVRALPSWRDPRVALAMGDALEVLREKGLVFRPGEASDAVLVTHQLPGADLILSVLDAVPSLNLLAVWMPEAGYESLRAGELEEIRRAAELVEKEVNESLGMTGREKRFQIRIPATEARSASVLAEAPRILFDQRGAARPGSLEEIRRRLVMIYPSGLSSRAAVQAAAAEVRTLKHDLAENEASHDAKAFLLLKTAAEISEGTLSALLRSVIEGEKHYTFEDQKIPSEMLAALMSAQMEIRDHFESAA